MALNGFAIFEFGCPGSAEAYNYSPYICIGVYLGQIALQIPGLFRLPNLHIHPTSAA